MVDTTNAHTRGAGDTAELTANARRLLEDPAYVQAKTQLRENLVASLESTPSDGSPEIDNFQREICRTLRNLRAIDKLLSVTVQGGQLREKDFRSVFDDGASQH